MYRGAAGSTLGCVRGVNRPFRWASGTGNEQLREEGQADQAAGRVQQGAGGQEQGLSDAIGRTGGQEQAAGQGDQFVAQDKEGLGHELVLPGAGPGSASHRRGEGDRRPHGEGRELDRG